MLKSEVKLIKLEDKFLNNPNFYLNNKEFFGKFLEAYADNLIEMNIAKIDGILSIETFYDIIVHQLKLKEFGLNKEYIATIFRNMKSKYDRQKTGAIELKKGKSVLVDRVNLYLRQKSILNRYFLSLIKEFGIKDFQNAIEYHFNERSLT